jgi:hypothetical protein
VNALSEHSATTAPGALPIGRALCRTTTAPLVSFAGMVMNSRIDEFRALEYVDPKPFLVQLIPLEAQLARSALPKKVRTLRTHELKPWRETREGAIFAYAMGLRLGETIHVARAARENLDYDCVTLRRPPDGTLHFGPVQIKEIVPEYLNRDATIQEVIDGLARYGSSPDLNVVIHVNRLVHFDPEGLTIPKLPISTLWIMAAITRNQSRWALWGDFLCGDRGGREFDYPTS